MSQTDAVVGDLVEVVTHLPHQVIPTDMGVAVANVAIEHHKVRLAQARAELDRLQQLCEHSWCYGLERPTTISAEQVPGSPWRMVGRHGDCQIICSLCGLQYTRETIPYLHLCRCCLQQCGMIHVYKRFERRQRFEQEPDATLVAYLQGRLNALIWRPNGGLWVPYCSDCLLFDFVVEERPYDK